MTTPREIFEEQIKPVTTPIVKSLENLLDFAQGKGAAAGKSQQVADDLKALKAFTAEAETIAANHEKTLTRGQKLGR